MTQSKFTWPLPLADVVTAKIRKWFQNWENGDPIRGGYKVIKHESDDLQNQVKHFRLRFKVGFNLNQLTFLSDTFNAENSIHPVAIVFANAKANHEKMQDAKRIAVGAIWEQEYDFLQDDIRWAYYILTCIGHSRPTPSQEAEAKKGLETGNW